MLIIRQDGSVALLLDLLSLPKTYMGNLKAGDWQEQPLQQWQQIKILIHILLMFMFTASFVKSGR